MQQSHRPLTHARMRTKNRWRTKEFTFGFLVGGHYAHCPLTPIASPPQCLLRPFQQRRAKAKDRNA